MAQQPPRNRQELYERIQATSKDEVVLEEMVRLGFWPERSGAPGDPRDEMHRKAELQSPDSRIDVRADAAWATWSG